MDPAESLEQGASPYDGVEISRFSAESGVWAFHRCLQRDGSPSGSIGVTVACGAYSEFLADNTLLLIFNLLHATLVLALTLVIVFFMAQNSESFHSLKFYQRIITQRTSRAFRYPLFVLLGITSLEAAAAVYTSQTSGGGADAAAESTPLFWPCSCRCWPIWTRSSTTTLQSSARTCSFGCRCTGTPSR